MAVDGGNVKRLIETPAVSYMPSWVGERIVFGVHGEKLRTLAEEEKAGLVDVTRYWAEYVRQSGEGVNHYKRDPVHANELGEQVLGRIMAAFLTAEDD